MCRFAAIPIRSPAANTIIFHFSLFIVLPPLCGGKTKQYICSQIHATIRYTHEGRGARRVRQVEVQ
jgi:hypothetical protein